MSRVALATVLIAGLVHGCSKSAGKQETADNDMGAGGRVEVPGARGGAPKGAAIGGAPTSGAPGESAAVNDARYKLTPEEGQLAIEVPAGAKAGTETVAKVVVTPGSAYKVNTEFPTKLTLDAAQNVTFAKTELKAGGHDKSKGDAETFTEGNLTFLVKLTPSAPGSHTVNGTFKFAVCDKAGSTCLAKKEAIAIQVAAN
jgi:hypothetical protein